MTDTPPEVRGRMRAMMAARTAQERVAMACGMFTAARRLRRAMDGADGRAPAHLLRVTYATDLAPELMAAITSHLERIERDQSPRRSPIA